MNRSFASSPTLARGRLQRLGLLAALLASLAAAPALAEPRLVNFEQCMETSTDVVRLPAAATGTLTARECTICDSRRLKFGAQTRYYIGDEPVSYARLRSAASKSPVMLYVFYQTGTDTLTRLQLDAGAVSP